MKARFSVKGRLPGLNEIIGCARAHPMASATQKKKYTALCAKACEGVPAIDGPVAVSIVWYEEARRRDVDNIAAGVKFILDGMVAAGVIPDDSQKYVRSISHGICVDKDNPRIEVEIYAAEEVDGVAQP